MTRFAAGRRGSPCMLSPLSRLRSEHRWDEEGHRLQEAHIERGRAAGAFTVEPGPPPRRRLAGRALGRARHRRDLGGPRVHRRRAGAAGSCSTSPAPRSWTPRCSRSCCARPPSCALRDPARARGHHARGAAGARAHAHDRAVHARGRPRGGARAAALDVARAGRGGRGRAASASGAPACSRGRRASEKPACRKSLPADAASTVLTVRAGRRGVQAQADERERGPRPVQRVHVSSSPTA